jgi:hypothetical protein
MLERFSSAVVRKGLQIALTAAIGTFRCLSERHFGWMATSSYEVVDIQSLGRTSHCTQGQQLTVAVEQGVIGAVPVSDLSETVDCSPGTLTG